MYTYKYTHYNPGQNIHLAGLLSVVEKVPLYLNHTS